MDCEVMRPSWLVGFALAANSPWLCGNENGLVDFSPLRRGKLAVLGAAAATQDRACAWVLSWRGETPNNRPGSITP